VAEAVRDCDRDREDSANERDTLNDEVAAPVVFPGHIALFVEAVVRGPPSEPV
jgi:hypothetical protein